MAEEPLVTEAPVSYRRYLLLKRRYWLEMDNRAMEGVFRGLQEAQPGNALPVTFPFRIELAAAGYSTREDLTGADQRELWTMAGLSLRDADAVLTALAALPP
jgi:hypothetical protein